MRSTSQHDFKTTELDLDLLSTPYRVQTNWHVITGAPCCGKTTLVDQLASEGFQTVPETARRYIESKMANGKAVHPILANAAALQRKLKDMQLSVEGGLQPSDVLFLDAALPTCLAWFRAYGLNPNEMLLDCFHHRYASIFMLDPLPFQPDDERVKEITYITGFLDHWQTRDYEALGYRVERVPVLPPEDRLAFVLQRFSEQGE